MKKPRTMANYRPCLPLPLILWLLMMVTTRTVCNASTESWWSTPKTKWKKVSPDFNWTKRRTGTSPTWSTHFGLWSHYRPKELTKSSWWRIFSSSKNDDIVITNARPWTLGRMCKFLRQVDTKGDTSFELKSVYENSAKGDWCKGFIQQRTEMNDDVPLWQMGHVFQRTPYRVTTLPAVLPPSLEGLGAETSRVTIVMPDGCTVSGPRWLPTNEQAEELKQFKDGDNKALRFQFIELWLGESTGTDMPESTKVGAFIMYDGVSGELVQIFRMKEVLILRNSEVDPDGAISMKDVEDLVDDTKGRLLRKDDNVDASLLRALCRGQSLDGIIRQKQYTHFSGRAVRTLSPSGVEEECSFKGGSVPLCSSISADDNKVGTSQHVDCRFDDGVYLRIPKHFRPKALLDDAEVCMELGCLRLDGGFHRVRMMGSRDVGGFETCVYERWS